MNGAILGLSHSEIDGKYEAIVRFADIGDFIDQPVRTYSSGMYVRLAFSIAINVDPEILVIDEALSVGDESFQRKCFAKIQELRDSGCTILLVSHDTGILAELCDRVLLLDEGQCIASGTARHILLQYHRLTSTPEAQRGKIREEIMALNAHSAVGESIEQAVCRRGQSREEINEASFYDPSLVPESTTRYVRRGAEITEVVITTVDGRQVNNLILGEDYKFTFRVRFYHRSARVRFGMIIKSLGGIAITGASTAAAHDGIAEVPAGSLVSATFTFSCEFLPEIYFIDCGVICVIDGHEKFLDRRGDVAMFKVLPEAGLPRIGLVNLTRTTSVVFETNPNTLVEIQPP